jgi:alkaline phosphatase
MTYMADRSETSAEPTLTQMTTKAIELLQDRGDGYYLLVEGGRIDHGHHAGQAGKALMEAQEFAKAIQAAVDMVDLDETLIMVTADHSHTMTMSGYPTRNNGILDVVHNNDEHGAPKEKPVLLLDKKPYTTLTYANGPGYVKGERKTPGTGIRATQQALLPTYSGDPEGEHRLSETHGGDDVALFATGARADVVRGVVEQNMIFHIIANAYGWDFD